MRNGSSNRRQRGRGGSNRGNGGNVGNNRSQVFDSNGPDVRIRGTAHQVCEKYLALAKDAQGSGDFVMAQNYLQHAEHYQRILNTYNDNQARTAQKNTSQNGEEKSSSPEKERGNEKPSKDDLSLPVSILGDAAEVKSEAVEAV